ncbi:hypothetical protein TWF694_004675 [Orbilia ellipsospora]|uniref:Uncharacterized protein n=1 Tax=Orbilia ellipsospora TaxID=2528407 RepID=A0AAV9WW67_9PEZI
MMMRFFATALLAALGVTADQCRACNYDVCGKAINTNPQGRVDCSSYFRTTVTQAAVTVTETVSVTTNTIETSLIILPATTTFETVAKRQVTAAASPFKIPPYASVCGDAIRYASACSCVGATHTTITVAARTKTVTITTASTVTDHASATSRPFILVVDDIHYFAAKTDATGTYATLTLNASAAVQFYIDPRDHYLYAIGYPQTVGTDPVKTEEIISPMWFSVADNNAVPFSCGFEDDNTNHLVCAAGPYEYWGTVGDGANKYAGIEIANRPFNVPPSGMPVNVTVVYIG